VRGHKTRGETLHTNSIVEKRRAWGICTVKEERIRPYLVGDVECLNAWVKTNECLLVTGGAVGASEAAKRAKG
jgi:hypothetical protein